MPAEKILYQSSLLLLCLTLLLPLLALAADNPPAKPAFFTAKQIDGRWWLIDPNGKPFISKGVDAISYHSDNIKGTNTSPYANTNKQKYQSEPAWREAAAKHLAALGFNSLGAWSDQKLSEIEVNRSHLAYSPNIDLGSAFVAQKIKGGQAWLQGIFPDVFDPDFEKSARETALKRCTPHKNDPNLIAWFTDNELRWGPDWRGKDELLTLFLNLPPKTPGRAAAIALLQSRYKNFPDFNSTWKTPQKSWDELAAADSIKPPFTREAVYAQNQETENAANQKDPARAAFAQDCDAFTAQLAERYFKICSDAVKAADPNHMNFGCRFAYLPPKPVIAAAAKYLDGISLNCYATDPRPILHAYAAFNKPLIIGEFSFRGEDAGLPNTKGAGPKVKTQPDRAAAFTNYLTWALSEPNLVGYHWFKYTDEPKEGRFDGENSNYGIVNIHDEDYAPLAQAMTALNAQAEKLHTANH